MANVLLLGGRVRFDIAAGVVGRGDATARLEPQPSAVLALLTSRPGELFTHEDIRRAVWNDATHVNFQQGVHYCIRQIRVAVGDDGRPFRFIESVPRRGYRFVASVAVAPETAPPVERSITPERHFRLALVASLLVVALVSAGIVIEQRPNRHHEMTVAFLKAVHTLLY